MMESGEYLLTDDIVPAGFVKVKDKNEYIFETIVRYAIDPRDLYLKRTTIYMDGTQIEMPPVSEMPIKLSEIKLLFQKNNKFLLP